MHGNGLAPETQVLRQRAEINRLTKEVLELRRARWSPRTRSPP